MSEHVHRAAREGFGRAALAYERGRPGYPPEAVAWLVSKLALDPCSTIADLGAGTGKLTAQLVDAGLRPLAVEPVDAMREALGAPWTGGGGGDAPTTPMPLEDRGLDAVVCGQAFHWFDGAAALREIQRVLRPGGGLGLIWNRRDEEVPWVRRLTELMEPHRGDAPRYGSGAWRRAFDATALFTPLEGDSFRLVQELAPEGVRDRVASVSFVAALPEPQREALLRDIDEVVAGVPASEAGTVSLPYVTDVWACRRADA
jgi:SAM-dependent methyltransferase